MDPIENPFEPGAGTHPPELAGRDAVLESARVSLGRVRIGRTAKSLVLIGLRGVGKTVLLDHIRKRAESESIVAVRMEAPEGRSLPGVLAPRLRESLIRLSATAKAKQQIARATRALAGFVKSLKVKFADLEVVVDAEPEPGLADNGDLESDLSELLVTVGEAAKAEGTALALLIDELQYVPEEDLGALVTALHRVSQESLPVILIAAGLPQLPGQLGRAKSYAERLIAFETIGPLNRSASEQALVKPVEAQGARITRDAVSEIYSCTVGYPYFIQEWGKHAWNHASGKVIRQSDVRVATRSALAALDASFFQVRLDRMTNSERRYMRAMAELGDGPHRSSNVADLLVRPVQSLGPVRASLISKGMIWSPGHGEIDFTVPMFHSYLRRAIPNLDDA